ncbi:polymer-forming cytoskeletal protein, partial [bacterium]|nr:polymer-forming cytoskeletal protein [bacterium]
RRPPAAPHPRAAHPHPRPAARPPPPPPPAAAHRTPAVANRPAHI